MALHTTPLIEFCRLANLQQIDENGEREVCSAYKISLAGAASNVRYYLVACNPGDIKDTWRLPVLTHHLIIDAVRACLHQG